MAQKPKKIKPSWVPERKPFGRRNVDNQEFYNSYRWRKVRRLFLNKYPLCTKCEDEGRLQSAKFVDHIQRVADGGEKFDEDNLQSLCDFHHNQKSGREAHGYRENKKDRGKNI